MLILQTGHTAPQNTQLQENNQTVRDYAQQNGVDLILITRNIDPPVVKAIELNKYYYQEEKKLKESKKGQKKSQTKDITFGIFIGENDFNAVIISTSPNKHGDFIRWAIGKKKHFFVPINDWRVSRRRQGKA